MKILSKIIFHFLFTAKSETLEISKVETIFSQLLSVLSYLKTVGVVYNDIRPANILFKNNLLKLADFGLSSLNNEQESSFPSFLFRRRDSKGIIILPEYFESTPEFKEALKLRCNPYKSPEMLLLGLSGATHKSDIYSVGGIMIRLMLNSKDKQEIWNLMDDTKRIETFTNLRKMHCQDLLNILERMVALSPKDRSDDYTEKGDYSKFMQKNTQNPKNDQFSTESNLHFILRSDWGARPSKKELDPLPHPVKMVIIIHSSRGEGYCTSDESCVQLMKEIQDLHMDHNKWDDIAYQ